MKFSYSILKNYLPNLPSVEVLKQDLEKHLSSGVSLHFESPHLKDVYIGKVEACEDHPNSDKLHVCQVEANGQKLQIVCGATNVTAGIKVPIAVVGACLWGGFVIQKTILRGEKSEGMICSLDELGLAETRQEGIYILPDDAPLGMNMADYLGKNDTVIELDEDSILARHDLHGYLGLIRELSHWYTSPLPTFPSVTEYQNLPLLHVENQIPQEVARYTLLKIQGVWNGDTPTELKKFIEASPYKSRGFLIDLSNACLAWLGQPNHVFDANRIVGKVSVRMARDWETFHGLDDLTYTLTSDDLVIADEVSILALGGIMWGMESGVTQQTKNIFIESATFSPARIKATSARLGIETPSALSFLTSCPLALASVATTYMETQIKNYFPEAQTTGFYDSNPNAPLSETITFQKNALEELIGGPVEDFSTFWEVLGIWQDNLVSKSSTPTNPKSSPEWQNMNPKIALNIPYFRSDIKNLADLASEYVRLSQKKMTPKLPRLFPNAQGGAPLLRAKIAHFLAWKGFFEVLPTGGETAMESLIGTKKKNPLTSSIFGFFPKEKEILLCVVCLDPNTWEYYQIQRLLCLLLEHIGIGTYSFDIGQNLPIYAHSGQSANLVIRGKKAGLVGTFSQIYREEKSLKGGYIEISLSNLAWAISPTKKEKTDSLLAHKMFDLSILSEKKPVWNELLKLLETSDPSIVSVELFDLYENEEKIPWKRSLSYRIFYRVSDGSGGEIASIKAKIEEKISKKGFFLRV